MNMQQEKYILFSQYCISHAILYFPRGLSAKKEFDKQSRRVFLKQTERLQDSAIEIERNVFCNYEKNFPETAKE
jgi:hypothetical protein